MAGKKGILTKVKGLFRKKGQAPSSPLSSSSSSSHVPPLAKPMSAGEAREIGILVHEWVRAKGYRLPHRTMQEAAKSIGTDSVKLHRYCVNSLGMDFRAWRTGLRVEDAKKIMAEDPSIPASHVARMVGIMDRSNFFRQFTLITGMSPDDWRKNHSK